MKHFPRNRLQRKPICPPNGWAITSLCIWVPIYASLFKDHHLIGVDYQGENFNMSLE